MCNNAGHHLAQMFSKIGIDNRSQPRLTQRMRRRELGILGLCLVLTGCETNSNLGSQKQSPTDYLAQAGKLLKIAHPRKDSRPESRFEVHVERGGQLVTSAGEAIRITRNYPVGIVLSDPSMVGLTAEEVEELEQKVPALKSPGLPPVVTLTSRPVLTSIDKPRVAELIGAKDNRSEFPEGDHRDLIRLTRSGEKGVILFGYEPTDQPDRSEDIKEQIGHVIFLDRLDNEVRFFENPQGYSERLGDSNYRCAVIALPDYSGLSGVTGEMIKGWQNNQRLFSELTRDQIPFA